MDRLNGNLQVRGMHSGQVWDYENGFMWFSEPSRLLKITAHFELFKLSLGLPGDIVEFGTYKANSLIRFATFRHLLEAEKSRKIFSFDAFGEFPVTPGMSEEDLSFVKQFEFSGGVGLSVSQLKGILKHKNFNNIDLVPGDINTTFPRFLNDNPQQRFSLVHLDLDTYEPTALVLESIWDRLVPNGVIIFDDYGIIEGETRAVDFFVLNHQGVVLKKLPNYKSPTFIVKES